MQNTQLVSQRIVWCGKNPTYPVSEVLQIWQSCERNPTHRVSFFSLQVFLLQKLKLTKTGRYHYQCFTYEKTKTQGTCPRSQSQEVTKLELKNRSDFQCKYSFVQLFFHSYLQKYLLHIYYVPDAILGIENTVLNMIKSLLQQNLTPCVGRHIIKK